MIKVLYIIYTLQTGGIESLGMNIFRSIDRSKFHFDFLVIKEPGTKQFFDDEVIALGGRIIPVGDLNASKINKYLSCEKGIYQAIKNGNYDVVHINSGHIHTLPEVISAKKLGVKNVIVHSHNGMLTSRAKFYGLRCIAQKLYRNRVSKYADYLLTCSDLASEWAFTKKDIDDGRVIQINNGIDLKRYRFDECRRAEIRRNLKINNELVVGHIGRMSRQKNHGYLFRIFRALLGIRSEAKLLLCGTGEMEKELRQLAQELGVEDKVVFYGVSDDVPGMLSAMDIFVFPSLFEGLPVVGIEAQASGLPVLASDTISQDVALTPSWHSMSIAANPEEWAKKIVELSNLAPKRIDNGEILKEAGFDILETVHTIENIYQKQI